MTAVGDGAPAGQVVAMAIRVEATMGRDGWHVELSLVSRAAGADYTEVTPAWGEGATLALAYAAAWHQLAAAAGLPFLALAEAMDPRRASGGG